MSRLNFFKIALLISLLTLCYSKKNSNFKINQFAFKNKSQLSIDHQSAARKQLSTLTQAELDQDWKLDTFFGCIYVINLPEAKTRLELARKQLNDVGVKNFEVLPATDGRKEVAEAVWNKMRRKSPHAVFASEEKQKKYEQMLQGQTGCYLSHLRLVETVREKFNHAVRALAKAKKSQDQEKIEAARALVKKYSSVLVLEDDNGFGVVSLDRESITKQGVGSLLRKAMAELPPDWDLVYFMSLPCKPSEKGTEHLARLKGAVVLNAFAINHRMYDKLYHRLKKIRDPAYRKVHPVDVEYSRLHVNARCYGIIPSIAFQDTGLSSITSVTAKHVRQIQSYQDSQAEQFINGYSSLLLHSFTTGAENDMRFQFSENSCTLKDLKNRLYELEKNRSEGLKHLRKKIVRRFDEFLTRKVVEGKRHCFHDNLCLKRALNWTRLEKLNANDVVMGQKANYLLHATPESQQEVQALFDTALQKNCSIFVSVLRSEDAKERWNNFWKKKLLSRVSTPAGWTINEVSRKVLADISGIKIVESHLEACSKKGEKKMLTHLHYDGWQQDTSIPNRMLFCALLDRIEELDTHQDAPLVLHSTWGVGRNGVTAVSHFLRQEIRAQLASGIPLDKVTINITKAIFDFRKQRNGFVEHEPLIRDVYLLMIEYYECLKRGNQVS